VAIVWDARACTVTPSRIIVHAYCWAAPSAVKEGSAEGCRTQGRCVAEVQGTGSPADAETTRPPSRCAWRLRGKSGFMHGVHTAVFNRTGPRAVLFVDSAVFNWTGPRAVLFVDTAVFNWPPDQRTMNNVYSFSKPNLNLDAKLYTSPLSHLPMAAGGTPQL
jgi:hypothetical protein